ncbi:MAG: dioxygenase [Rhodospirillales bacterium]|nr:dioxygenase [Rhodospirillales bacterium]
MSSLPGLFLSHGAPTIPLTDSPVRAFWRGLKNQFECPKSILSISAHWETDIPSVSLIEKPETIHDFYGFPEQLYEQNYPAPGAPDLARTVASLLSKSGIDCRHVSDRGIDHGTWIPLMEMYPDADIPVTQLSIQAGQDIAHHIAVGRALSSLRNDGVLVLASGGAVHNLSGFHPGSDKVPDWARRFDDWLADTLARGDVDALINYRTEDGAKAHPRDEHLLPLGVAMGAGGDGAKGRALHRGFMDGALSTAAYAFG